MKSDNHGAAVDTAAAEIARRVKGSKNSFMDKKNIRYEDLVNPFQAGVALAQSGADAFRRSLHADANET